MTAVRRHGSRPAPDASRRGGEKCQDGGANFASPGSIGVVGAETGDGPERGEVTRGLIERIAGGVQGAKLCSQVVAWNTGATREQVAEAFQEACTLAVRSCRGQSEGEVYVWLRTTTHRELGHMRRRTWTRATREQPAPESSTALSALTPPALSAEDEVIERERLAELEQLTGALLAGLDERQRQIVALHSHGCRRQEIARHLGITQRSVKRALERIMALSRAELVRRAGQGCGSGEQLVSRLAFGLAGEREIRDAQLHLATCPRCGALYERLDLWREKVAAVLPVPAIAHAQPRAIERVAHALADHLPISPRRSSGRLGIAARPRRRARRSAQAARHRDLRAHRRSNPDRRCAPRRRRRGHRGLSRDRR